MLKIKSNNRFLLSGLFLALMLPLAVECQPMRDPTMPPDYRLQAADSSLAKDLALEAVYVTNSHSSAVINNEIVEVGGVINNFQVVEINDNWVKLKGAAGVVILPLLGEVVKNYQVKSHQNKHKDSLQ